MHLGQMLDRATLAAYCCQTGGGHSSCLGVGRQCQQIRYIKSSKNRISHQSRNMKHQYMLSHYPPASNTVPSLIYCCQNPSYLSVCFHRPICCFQIRSNIVSRARGRHCFPLRLKCRISDLQWKFYPLYWLLGSHFSNK